MTQVVRYLGIRLRYDKNDQLTRGNLDEVECLSHSMRK